MIPILRPLFVYRKFHLAEKILKNCCGTFAVLSNDPDEQPLLTEKQYPNTYVAVNFLNKHYSIDSARIIEAIDLLEKNNHIACKRRSNLYEFSITCTKEGESAFNDGYYKKRIFLFWFKIISAPIVIFLLSKLLQWLKIL